MKPILKQKKGGPVPWKDARLTRKRRKKKLKGLTEIERLRRGIGCAKGSELKLIPDEYETRTTNISNKQEEEKRSQ